MGKRNREEMEGIERGGGWKGGKKTMGKGGV